MSKPTTNSIRKSLYDEVASEYGAALQRLATGYEADAERRRDLLQEIHLALWKSLEGFKGECSLRTWVYRVGHNVSINHATKDERARSRMQLGLDEMQCAGEEWKGDDAVDSEVALKRLTLLVQRLKMPDRQIMLLYLEDVDGKTIAEVTGLSEGNVATRIHRIKQTLASEFRKGEQGNA